MKELLRITVDKEFSEYIKLSEKRKLKPFIRDSKKKLPKKYQTEDYVWNAKGQLAYARTGSLVPSNPKVVGTPRYWKINGQDIYNQKVKHSHRAAIMNKLHAVYEPLFHGLKPLEETRLILHLNFYVLDEGKHNVDNDNRWIWEKVIQDSMTATGFLPEDNPYIIRGNYKETFFVERPEDRKLEIILYQPD